MPRYDLPVIHGRGPDGEPKALLVDVDGKLETVGGGGGGGGGSVTVTNFPVTQPVSGNVGVTNFPTALQVSNVPATSLDVLIRQGGNNSTIRPGNSLSVAGDTAFVVALRDSARVVNDSANPFSVVSSLPDEPAIVPVTVLNGDLFSGNVSGYQFASFQLTGPFVGTVTVQCSNDNTNWVTAIASSPGFLSQFISSLSTLGTLVNIPISFKYLRLRVTAYTSGTAGGVLLLYKDAPGASFTNGLVGIAGTVPVSFSSGTISSVGSSNLGVPGIILDVASAAITASANTTAITPAFGSSYQVFLNVTAVTGVTPVYGLAIQESFDSGTSWFTVFTFPNITANGLYRSPVLPSLGNRIRYVQVVSGTTPSFTRSITRIQSSLSPDVLIPNVFTNAAIVAGGVSQVAAVGNSFRKYYEIHNTSAGDLWFNPVAVAAVDVGIRVLPNTISERYYSSLPINIFGATTGQKYIIVEG